MNITGELHSQWCHAIGQAAHFGQTRRDGVTPYFSHCEDVASRLNEYDYAGRSVAYLHDSIEDTCVTRESLISKGVSKTIVDAVVALTKVKGESYDRYLMNVYNNPLARKVKIADMLSNLSDTPSERQVKKYAKGLQFLIKL